LVVLLQNVDELTAFLRGKEHANESIAVVRAINHQLFHLFIADSIVQLFKLRIAKAELCHPLRQALPQNIIVLQFGYSVRAHIAREAVGPELVVVPLELSDGGVVELDVSDTEGGASPDVDVDVPTAVLPVAMDSCAGVEVDETNGGACAMYEPSGWTA
jgi:hypothetical protein